MQLSPQVVVNEVYKEMVSLRVRDIVRSDSARLSSAIRCVAVRRRVSYQEIESTLDTAMAFRVRRIQ